MSGPKAGSAAEAAEERPKRFFGMPRWMLGLATAAILLAIAIWTATPSGVTVPAAEEWAGCFEPITLPVATDPVALVRQGALEPRSPGSGVREAPVLTAGLLRATEVRPVNWQMPSVAEGVTAGQRTTLAANQKLALPTDALESFSLEKGFLELRRANGNGPGARFLVEPGALFDPEPTETYTAELVAPVEVETVGADGRVRLSQDTKVRISLPDGDPAGKPVYVRQTKRLLVGPLLLASTTSAIVPDVRPDREAAPYLAARLAAPGLSLDPAERPLRACLWLGEKQPTPLPISHVGASGRGVAELVLGLPSDPFPWLNLQRGRAASLAVVATDGSYAGMGRFVYKSRSWAFGLATLFTLALFIGLVWLRDAGKEWKCWFMGLFLGEDGQPSLSLFQILLWTIMTIWALLFVFFSTGYLLAMTQEVMVLLGFAGAGSLAARWVSISRPKSSLGTEKVVDTPRFWALLENNNNTLDLFKLQLFLFTLIIALYVAFRVVQQSAFPAISPEFLLLMGVSNGLYVGSKVGQTTSPFALAQQRKVELDALRLRVDDLEKEIAEFESRSKDLATRIGDPATDAATRQNLTDQKSLADKRITDAKAELARARTDRDAKDTAYKEAMAALGKV